MSFFLAIFLLAQGYAQRGFLETQFTLYPQTAPGDSGRAIGETIVRYEGFYKPTSGLEFSGSVDLRLDTHHQTARTWRFSWTDRELQRPPAAIRNLRALYHRGGVTIEAGKQFVRWGKTDIVTPTDRFSPRDFLAVVDNDFLAVTAARTTYEKGAFTIDGVWAPFFTPSRIPLSNQRWFNSPPSTPMLRQGTTFPNDGEFGVRLSRTGLVEYSISYYRGFNHAPSFEFRPSELTLERLYPKVQMIGGDVAIPFRWLTVKMEAADFSSPDKRSDEFFEYVVQLERQSGEWSFVGGYAGEFVRNRSRIPSFDPDRGLVRTFVGRAGYTLDAARSLAAETAIRQNGEGFWTKLEYSQAFGQHWRLTTGIGIIGGSATDFLGQYDRNSHFLVVLRYSF